MNKKSRIIKSHTDHFCCCGVCGQQDPFSEGLIQDTATQVQKEAAVNKAELKAVVILYLCNINQAWHGPMVRYLEDSYATRNDIYPTSLPDVYRLLYIWKTFHYVQGKFTGRLEGITLTTANDQEEEGKYYACFIVLGKEHILS